MNVFGESIVCSVCSFPDQRINIDVLNFFREKDTYHLFFPDKNDPRVLKQIHWVKDDYHVTVSGFGDLYLSGVEFIKIAEPRTKLLKELLRRSFILFGFYQNYYWSLLFVVDAYSELKDREFDIIIVNELQALPLALKVREKAKILFDAREFYL